MSIQYVTPGVSSMIRHALEPLYFHTYTRQQQVPTPDDPTTASIDESIDEYEEQKTTYADPVPGQRCLYQEDAQTFIQPNGPLNVNIPIMMVPVDDPIEMGDLVSSIMTAADLSSGVSSVVLVQGPIEVEEITLIAPEFGGVMYKLVHLRQITEVLL